MIDWDRVSELYEQVGAEDFEEVVDLFLEEVAEVIDTLRLDPQASRLEADLHFLKGSALNLGFADFSDKCSTGERQAAQGQADQIDIGGIIGSYDASRNLFCNELTKRFAA
ncbi:Hpt domain-containing protein [Thalassovita sp.]|jgi:HPt (histidine-containing phosphotransfer) domain-containing protein|uniref:Hpt domain-containing protein n=1 Tax=Thalassovita sp. TaxID=1979401 RepID=UPI003B5CA3E1